jgi:hypothetical protein
MRTVLCDLKSGMRRQSLFYHAKHVTEITARYATVIPIPITNYQMASSK